MDQIAKLTSDIKTLRREIRELRQATEEASPKQAKDLIEKSNAIIDELRCTKERMVYGQKISYTNQEVANILGVTTKTLKKWRDNGLLGFSQIGSVYQYSPDDIALLLKHTHFDPSMFI